MSLSRDLCGGSEHPLQMSEECFSQPSVKGPISSHSVISAFAILIKYLVDSMDSGKNKDCCPQGAPVYQGRQPSPHAPCKDTSGRSCFVP